LGLVVWTSSKGNVRAYFYSSSFILELTHKKGNTLLSVTPSVQMSRSSFGSIIQEGTTTVRSIIGHTLLKSGHFLRRQPMLVSLYYIVSLTVECLYCVSNSIRMSI
jgi:hypothetical protein